jgi:predicted nucleotidyltransferase
MSIIFHHYKQLIEIKQEIEQEMESKWKEEMQIPNFEYNKVRTAISSPLKIVH